MRASRRALAARLLVLLPLACALAAPPLAAQPGGVTLETLLRPAFPYRLTAAPAGGLVAWVQDAEGARNAWVAGPPDYRGRRLTAYAADDGQDISGLALSSDGRLLVYVRGSGPNRQGESPNPPSDPAGTEQAVWRLPVAGGKPVRIGAGSGAAISPRGDRVAWVQGGQVWSAPLAGKGEAAQLVKARGRAMSLRWAPDGNRLAFVSHRGDHAFVGVYDFAARRLRWLAPSVDGDHEPAWSPDGARIAFLREPASTKVDLFRPVREGEPWSIWVADAATGAARPVWRADPGRGSVFHAVEADNQLFWGAGDRIVFPWEKTGWVLLYSLPAGGGEATLLTPGEFEVEHAAPTADGREVVYSSNQDDIDRRHLWRVAVAGGPPVAITRGEEIEWEPTPTADGRALAYFRSGARRPAQAVVRIGEEVRELAPGSIPPDFLERDLVVPQAVRLTAADGLEVPAQLFLPAGIAAGERRPAVVFLHGGSRRQMLLGFHSSPYYHHAYALNQFLASRGFVVLALNFRGGIGYGLDFREAANQGAAGGSELYDVLGAGLYLRGRPEVDPARIGLWGGSYGGYLTAMALSRASALFAAGVDLHGVHDWNVGIQTFVPDYQPLATPEESRRAFDASPMASLDGWRSPVLVIHGDDDRNVAFKETVALVEALRQHGVEVEQLVLPDEVHSFLRHASWLAAHRATAEFLERKLGGGR